MTVWTVLSSTNLHRLCVKLLHIFLDIDISDITANYVRLSDLFMYYVPSKSKALNFKGYFQMRISKGFSNQILKVNTSFYSESIKLYV